MDPIYKPLTQDEKNKLEAKGNFKLTERIP